MENVDSFELLPKSNDWKLKIIENTIDKINKNSDSISIRKTPNYINNILINSSTCAFYKKYYELKGEKVKKLPTTKKVYDYEDLFLKIDDKYNDDGILNSVLDCLKNYLVCVLYFPDILEYRDKETIKHYNIKLLDYLKDLDKYTTKEILNHNGILIFLLTVADSHEEYRSYNLLKDLENNIKSINTFDRTYKYFFTKNMINKEYDEQFSKFEEFSNNKGYELENIFAHDYVNPQSFWILNPIHSDPFNKKKTCEKINFTGDFIKDYLSLVKAYKNYYK